MEKISGYIDHIIFRNEDNGYTVMVMICDGEEVTCVGTLQYINEGELIEAEGTYTQHSTYGTQFKISSFELKAPEDEMAMERYLGSGADGRKKRCAQSNDFSAEIWDFLCVKCKDL